MENYWRFLILTLSFFSFIFIRYFWTRRKKRLAAELAAKRIVSKPPMEKKPTLVRIDKEHIRSGMVGLIILCDGDGIFFTGKIKPHSGVACADTAQDILNIVVRAQLRESLYQILPLPPEINELARAWLAVFDKLAFLSGTKTQLEKLCPDVVHELLGLKAVFIPIEEIPVHSSGRLA